MLLIAIGTGRPLTSPGLCSGVDWTWTIGLAAARLSTLLFGGFGKVTVPSGPFIIIGGFLSALGWVGRLSVDVGVPILVTFIGVLLLVARLPVVPALEWGVDRRTGPRSTGTKYRQRSTEAYEVGGRYNGMH